MLQESLFAWQRFVENYTPDAIESTFNVVGSTPLFNVQLQVVIDDDGAGGPHILIVPRPQDIEDALVQVLHRMVHAVKVMPTQIHPWHSIHEPGSLATALAVFALPLVVFMHRNLWHATGYGSSSKRTGCWTFGVVTHPAVSCSLALSSMIRPACSREAVFLCLVAWCQESIMLG